VSGVWNGGVPVLDLSINERIDLGTQVGGRHGVQKGLVVFKAGMLHTICHGNSLLAYAGWAEKNRWIQPVGDTRRMVTLFKRRHWQASLKESPEYPSTAKKACSS